MLNGFEVSFGTNVIKTATITARVDLPIAGLHNAHDDGVRQTTVFIVISESVFPEFEDPFTVGREPKIVLDILVDVIHRVIGKTAFFVKMGQQVILEFVYAVIGS